MRRYFWTDTSFPDRYRTLLPLHSGVGALSNCEWSCSCHPRHWALKHLRSPGPSASKRASANRPGRATVSSRLGENEARRIVDDLGTLYTKQFRMNTPTDDTEDDERVDGLDPRIWKVATVDFPRGHMVLRTRILKTRFLWRSSSE
jgi:hypothetical protein